MSLKQALLADWHDADPHWPVVGGLGQLWTIHATAEIARDEVPDWDKMRSFAFVRNPWDRMVSVWRKFAPNLDFPTFVNRPAIFGLNQRPQVAWLFDRNGKQIVDDIGRFEDLNRDFAQIAASWGSTAQPLPHINATDHADWRSYYTPELRDHVSKTFAADIETFGYRF
jgi:hypothetical protein